MKTKKVITMGVLVMVFWLGLFLQPQLALAANREAGAENMAGISDTENRVSDNPQENSRAGGNTWQETDPSGMMPDAPGGNVSNMFNAETVIIGFTSGALGVLIIYLLCIPINLVLHRLTGIGNLSASLPMPVAIILIVISIVLTLISGIIPSRSVAKKDPVVALRTE